jgi:hypothetical protein
MATKRVKKVRAAAGQPSGARARAATKTPQAKGRVAPKKPITAELFDSAGATQFVCVMWKPVHAASAPLKICAVTVNSVVLTPVNPADPTSPRAFHVPSSMAGTKVQVFWHVEPAVTLTRLGIGLTTMGGGKKKLIDDTDDPANCSSTGVWQDDAPVQLY